MRSLINKYKGNIKENILLVAVWGAVIVTGFLALGATVGNIEGFIAFGRIHSLAVRLGLGYTVIHIFRHREQIMLHFGIRISRSKQAENRRLKNSRTVKVITAIVFHILLHRVSVHLVIGYTLLHIVQHRYGILSQLKKLSARRNPLVHSLVFIGSRWFPALTLGKTSLRVEERLLCALNNTSMHSQQGGINENKISNKATLNHWLQPVQLTPSTQAAALAA